MKIILFGIIALIIGLFTTIWNSRVIGILILIGGLLIVFKAIDINKEYKKISKTVSNIDISLTIKPVKNYFRSSGML